MKKLFTLILISTLFLSACNNNLDNGAEEIEEVEITEVLESDSPELNYKNFELGQTLEIGESEITVKSLEVITDSYGRENLKLIYDWTNTSVKTTSPSSAIIFQAFQDGVETDRSSSFTTDQLNNNSHKDVRPDATIENVESPVGIDDMSTALELELKPNGFSMTDIFYILTIDDLNSL